jgi:predicted phosphohydrolase
MTKLVCISDTHSYHRKVVVPDGDILICAGDITWRGELTIIADFCNWLQELPHSNKVVVFGNHELDTQSGPNRGVALQMVKDAGAIYLEDSGCKINELEIYGSPYQPYFNDWEYNLPRDGKELREKWNQIPETVSVLVTHGPPYGVLDGVDRVHEPQGCKLLKKRVKELSNLKLHVFGHMHKSGGQMLEIVGVKYVNAAICDDSYSPCRKPVVVEI